MPRILAINGSYREGGVIDQAVAIALQAVRAAGAAGEEVRLRDYPIGFCLNCRECMQRAGEQPGQCVQADGMVALIDKIEAADGFILASPTNFGTVTAVFKRFMERLAVYGYWPWGQPGPKMRKPRSTKKAVLLTSCAAPGLLGRLFFSTGKQLKSTARTIGAEIVGTAVIGLSAQTPQAHLSERARHRAAILGRRLLG